MRQAGRTALALVGLVALALVVALASRPEGGGLPLLHEGASRVLMDVLIYLFLFCCLLGALLVAWALWPRPGDERPRLERPRGMLGAALMTGLAVVLIVWLRDRHGGQLLQTTQDRPGQLGGPPGMQVPGPGPGPAGVDWLALGVVVALVAGAAVFAWRALRPRPSARGPRTALRDLQGLLDDAVDDVLREADPRRAVIVAWARLESLLTRHGLPRRESEAPFEYAARAGAGLALPTRSLERLAGLFEWARFSPHEVTPAMREEALGGLLGVRDGLRLAA